MEINSLDHNRQLRFRENLRWYLKNEVLLKLRIQRGHEDARVIVSVFQDVMIWFAQDKIDVFNEVVERYQVSGLKGAVYPDCSSIIMGELQDIVERSELSTALNSQPIVALKC